MAASGWFQVTCPACQAALQVELKAGYSRVRCCVFLSCKYIFDVYVSPKLLQDAVEPIIYRRPEARREPTAAQQAYRAYLGRELPRLRQQQPELAATDRMKLAAASWATAADNPARRAAPTADDAGTAQGTTDGDVPMPTAAAAAGGGRGGRAAGARGASGGRARGRGGRAAGRGVRVVRRGGRREIF